MPHVIPFGSDGSQRSHPPASAAFDRDTLEAQNDQDILDALLAHVPRATPDERLTLLTLLEQPEILAAVETLIHVIRRDGGLE